MANSIYESWNASPLVEGTFVARQKTSVSSGQLAKVKEFIILTELPMVRTVKLRQEKKALCPIDVTLLGIETEAKLLQSKKVKSPIDVTPLGNETEAKLLQP